MPPKKKPVAEAQKPDETLVRLRTDGLQTLQTLEKEINPLALREGDRIVGISIETEEDYLNADLYLASVVNRRKLWATKTAPIISPYEKIIAEAKLGMAAAKKLDKEVDDNYDHLERLLKEGMAAYKRLEAENKEAEKRQELDRLAELQRQQNIKAAQLQAAKSAPIKARIAEERAALERQTEAVQQRIVEVEQSGVKGAASSSRKVKKVRIADIDELLSAMVDYAPKDGLYNMGQPPLSLIDRDALTAALNRIYREQPGTVKSWAGVEEYDDFTTARR